MIGIDTETFHQTQHQLLIALVSLAVIGVLLASALGYCGANRPQTADQTVPRSPAAGTAVAGRASAIVAVTAGTGAVRRLVQLDARAG